jgi:hypothetical protein
MAYEQPGFQISLTAGADLSGAQFKFVKLESDGEVIVCDGVTDIPVGVLQNKPESGQTAVIMVMGVTKVQGDGNLARGNLIGTSADGQAAAYTAGTDTTKYIVGQVLLDNSTAGGIASALIDCFAPHRGA